MMLDRPQRTFLFLLGSLSLSCHQPAALQNVPSRPAGPTITIHVYESASTPVLKIDGVSLVAVKQDGGEVHLGTTSNGSLLLYKGYLHSWNTRYLVLSHPDYYSGAIAVDDPQIDFYGFDEVDIDLARRVLR